MLPLLTLMHMPALAAPGFDPIDAHETKQTHPFRVFSRECGKVCDSGACAKQFEEIFKNPRNWANWELLSQGNDRTCARKMREALEDDNTQQDNTFLTRSMVQFERCTGLRMDEMENAERVNWSMAALYAQKDPIFSGCNEHAVRAHTINRENNVSFHGVASVYDRCRHEKILNGCMEQFKDFKSNFDYIMGVEACRQSSLGKMGKNPFEEAFPGWASKKN